MGDYSSLLVVPSRHPRIKFEFTAFRWIIGAIYHITTWNYNQVNKTLSINPSSANPAKLSNSLKQFVRNSRQIGRVCLTIF